MDWSLVGKRIREARTAAGMTQEDLAAKLDMSPTHISVLERGIKPPKLENFIRIANVLGISSDYLLQDVVDFARVGVAIGLAAEIEKLSAHDREIIVSLIRATGKTEK